MDTANMTAQELRELALERENAHATLLRDYAQIETESPVEESEPVSPFERVLEFEGEKYVVDMRRVKSRSCVRHIAKIQEASAKGEEYTTGPLLDLYDFIFSGKVDEHVVEVVTAKYGYDDAEEIMRIESALMEMLNVKNS